MTGDTIFLICFVLHTELSTFRSRWSRASNSCTRPMSRRFCRPVFFRFILEHFYLWKWKLHFIHQCIINMRCDKGKLLVLLTGLWDLKYILSSQQNPSENSQWKCRDTCTWKLLTPGYHLWAPVDHSLQAFTLCERFPVQKDTSFKTLNNWAICSVCILIQP